MCALASHNLSRDLEIRAGYKPRISLGYKIDYSKYQSASRSWKPIHSSSSLRDRSKIPAL